MSPLSSWPSTLLAITSILSQVRVLTIILIRPRVLIGKKKLKEKKCLFTCNWECDRVTQICRLGVWVMLIRLAIAMKSPLGISLGDRVYFIF